MTGLIKSGVVVMRPSGQPLYRCGIVLLVCLCVLASSATAVTQPSVTGPSEQDTKRVIDYLTSAVPEIAQMARNNPESRLLLMIEQAPDPTATNRLEREYYQVYVGFNIQDGGPGHRSRWATFLVNQARTEILWVNFLTGDSYVPLADWRQYIVPERKSDANDWMCIPFLRAGPIEPTSSIADINRMFGRQNVVRRTVYGPEGAEKFEVTVVYPGSADEILVFWRENIYGVAPERVSIRQEQSRWRTVYGIRPGTSIGELNRINGRPFEFYGFGWDYGGTIEHNWNEGTLSAMRGLSLRLMTNQQLTREYYGDRIIRSDMPALLPGVAKVWRVEVQLQ